MASCCSDKSDGNSDGDSGAVRNIQGVMRMGLFAGGLLLAGEATVEMVLLTAGKPTTTVLHSVAKALSDELPVRILACLITAISISIIAVIIIRCPYSQ